MIQLIKSQYKRPLNNRTPQWFKEWYGTDFVPVKVRQDIILLLLLGMLAKLLAS